MKTQDLDLKKLANTRREMAKKIMLSRGYSKQEVEFILPKFNPRFPYSFFAERINETLKSRL